MGSNNVIKFPGGSSGEPTPPPKKHVQTAAAAQNSLKNTVKTKQFKSILILAFATFALNFMFSESDSGFFGTKNSNRSNGRHVASVGPLSNLAITHQFDLGKMLASTEPLGPIQSVGRSPSSDDQVRHGVLASRGYVFKRSLESGNLVSIRLQADEQNPAYLLHPQDFLREYGDWLNSDFQNVEMKQDGEEVQGDRRISHFVLTTHNGKKYEIKIERDLFQRLTSLDQTEVAGNDFH